MLISTHWAPSVIHELNALAKIAHPANHWDPALEACKSTDLVADDGINGLADIIICTAASKMAPRGYTAAQHLTNAVSDVM